MKIKTPIRRKIPLIFSKNSKLRQLIPIILILLISLSLYLCQLGNESLWIDEVLSIARAEKSPFGNNFNLNRPLYFILLHYWMQFGSSEAWLRGLSVLFALGSIFLTYLLGCRLYSKTTGLIAALLLTLSPLAINHSQEVRMYMMSTCICLAGSLVLTYVFETPNLFNVSSWLSLRFLAVLTTPINILMLAPDLLLLGYQLRHQFRRLKVLQNWFWLLGILLIPTVLILVDVIPPMINFLKGKTGTIPPPGIIAFVGGLTKFTVWPLTSPWEGLAWFYDHFLNFYAAILICLLIIALFNKQTSIKHLWPALWGFLPLVAIFLVSQVVTSLWGVERYLIVAAPYILLLLAEGFVRVFQKQRRVAFLIIVVYAIAVSGALVHYYTTAQREDWRGVAQTIILKEKPQDAIAIFPKSFLPVLGYYYEDSGSALIYPIETFSGNQTIDKEDIEQALLSLPSENSRLWLVLRLYNFSIFQQQRQIFQAVIEEQYQIQKHEQFAGIDLYLVKSNSNYK